ncbi:nucleoside 2-deoxyribosyltransferase [Streptomyces sp. NPDC021212]|uniref:nucleoside 2-deoxyribosyltransferase n=1 Tax=Streptomyces sp. NPDC021212 TaxID=3365118 RepID=UPI00378DCD5F
MPLADPADPAGRTITVFLGGPFKGLIDPATGAVPDAARHRYEGLTDAFAARGWRVLNAHRTEGWGLAEVSDVECTRRDFAWMHECDVFVAFPGDPASPGTHVELGWATALGRPTVILLEPGARHAALVTGLPAVSDVHLLEYRPDPDFPEQVAAEVAALLPTAGTAEPASAARP